MLLIISKFFIWQHLKSRYFKNTRDTEDNVDTGSLAAWKGKVVGLITDAAAAGRAEREVEGGI